MNLDKVIKIKVSGRNVDNYIKGIIKRKINFIKVIPISDSEVDIILRFNDYLELIKYKSVLYRVDIIDNMGILKLKDRLNTNKYLLIFMIFGLVLLYYLSNVIFKVEVIHHDKNIRDLVYDELEDYGIYKYSFKKSFVELEEIKSKILEENKDKLEWLEIVINGTFVTVRVEERIINDSNNVYKYQSIVSKKNAVIREIKAVRGEILKEEGIYVKKGDVVISGYINHPDNSRGIVMAEGDVYGEVWYSVDINYPFVYQESNLTGRSNKGIMIKFFDNEFNLFNRGDYRSFSRKNKILFKDNLLDMEVVLEKRYEVDIKDEVYTEELVESRAISYVKDKMMSDNSNIKEVVKIEVLSSRVDFDGIEFKFFVTTLESIGEVLEINVETSE